MFSNTRKGIVPPIASEDDSCSKNLALTYSFITTLHSGQEFPGIRAIAAKNG
jgi:hypothetical protein